MRIFVAYPGHNISTFDVAEGWHQALKRLGHTVFHMNYEYNVPFYGEVLNYWKNKEPGFDPSFWDCIWLSSQDLVCKILEHSPFDFVLLVTGLLHHPRAFHLIRKLGIPTVIMFTESPYNDNQAQHLLPVADVVFTNDLNSVEGFKAVNPNSFYMPHSYDPVNHKPGDEPADEEHTHDVFFMGSLYDERLALFEELMEHDAGGAQFDIFVSKMLKTGEFFYHRLGFPNMLHDGGMLNTEVVKHYQGSKMVISPNRTTADYHTKTRIESPAWSLGPRVYEVAACGTFQLTDASRPELYEVFDDVIPVYRDAEGLATLIRHFMEHEDERKELAEKAREKVQPCTFENRAQQILMPILQEVL
jgi:spore maturation protein CgeB